MQNKTNHMPPFNVIATVIINQFQILDMPLKSMVVKDIMAGFADGVKGIGSAFGAGIGSLFKR